VTKNKGEERGRNGQNWGPSRATVEKRANNVTEPIQKRARKRKPLIKKNQAQRAPGLHPGTKTYASETCQRRGGEKGSRKGGIAFRDKGGKKSVPAFQKIENTPPISKGRGHRKEQKLGQPPRNESPCFPLCEGERGRGGPSRC